MPVPASKATLQATVNAVAKHKTHDAAGVELGITASAVRFRLVQAKRQGIKPNGVVDEKDPQVMAARVRKLEAELKAARAANDQLKPKELPAINRRLVAQLRSRIINAKGPVRYVVTSAQNATPVHAAFFKSLLTYCRHNDAQLVVIPYRYRNPTSRWTEANQSDDWWDRELLPYILDVRTPVNKHLILLADIKVRPTAVTPTSGLESLAGAMSAIIGHPKLELVTVPTPQARLPKILTTTGSVTQRNYVEAKDGKKGEFHHTFGACVVEVDGPVFHMRQLNAVRDGSFMDLTMEYDGDEVRPGGVAAVVMGDSHFEFMDPTVADATFGSGGILDVLRPKYTVWHDVFDFYQRNHHHIHEPFIEYVKAQTGNDDVSAWIGKLCEFIDAQTRARPWMTNVFVPSNHPDALAKWVKRADWRLDPKNAKFLLETTLAMLDSAKMGDGGATVMDPFAYWMKRRLVTSGQAVFLERDKSFMVRGVELGFHGDAGLNGARGSRRSFSRIGVKVVIGHAHTPGITGGAYQTGTNSRLKLEYTGGPSSWMHTDCIVYENGKRSLINIVDGKWRLA